MIVKLEKNAKALLLAYFLLTEAEYKDLCHFLNYSGAMVNEPEYIKIKNICYKLINKTLSCERRHEEILAFAEWNYLNSNKGHL